MVIRYSYLWEREAQLGQEEGVKDRPCAIVAAIKTEKTGETRVLVLPITHTAPLPTTPAIEISAKVKQRLKLDEARSWIILSEWNEFIWPGPDLRRLPGGDDATVVYGMLPPKLFAKIRNEVLKLVKNRVSKSVRRNR